MTQKRWLSQVLLVWAVAFAGAFVAWQVTEPSDSGFTRGMNRLGVFVRWQALAAVLAVVALVLGRGQPRASLWRRLGYLPLAALGLLRIGVVGAVIVGLSSGG
jgi:hypothetical protein